MKKASIKSKDKAQTVIELFNVKVNTCSTVLFQHYDNDCGEYNNVEINDSQNKNKVKVKDRQDNQDCGSVQVNLSICITVFSILNPLGGSFFRAF